MHVYCYDRVIVMYGQLGLNFRERENLHASAQLVFVLIRVTTPGTLFKCPPQELTHSHIHKHMHTYGQTLNCRRLIQEC